MSPDPRLSNLISVLDSPSEGIVSFDAMLSQYLITLNQPVAIVPAVKEAIVNASAGKWDKQVVLPGTIRLWGRSSVYTGEIIEALRLYMFLDTGRAS